jgi:predicted nucleic acid-binding protein
MPDGLLDTNVFLHAQTHDHWSEECRRFLAAVERGQVHARLEPMVLHELSYAMRHYLKQASREDTARYLLGILRWPGVEGDKEVLIEAVERWERTPGLGFVDAYLSVVASREGRPVYTKNIREFVGQGIHVPEPLPEPSP